MPKEKKTVEKPIIIDGKRYKYVESDDGFCQKCAGYDDLFLCKSLPSCSYGGYFIEVKAKKEKRDEQR
jgi:hypothetical protein